MKTLFKGGHILTMDEKLGDYPKGDILIEDDRIVQVGKNLPNEGCEVIDASNRIVLPGFVDTHRHNWQSPLRAVCSDSEIFEYMVLLRYQYCSCFSADDAYTANYFGALEGLNAGITTLVDHSHLINSPQHADCLVKGLQDSGTRGVYCYGFFSNPTQNPYSYNPDVSWMYEDARRVRKEILNDDNGRVLFGIAPSEGDFEFLAPLPALIKEIELGRELGAKVLSYHTGMGYDSDGRLVRDLAKHTKLLGPDILLVHCASFSDDLIEAAKNAGCGISSIPVCDLQMSMGHPIGLKYQRLGLRASIGTDINSNIAAEFFSPMKILLTMQRGFDNDDFFDKNGYMAIEMDLHCKDVVHLATMGGAKAINMDDKIGSLTPGKKADLQLIRTDSINMINSGRSPYGAVVFHANVHDISTVMVDGKFIKKDGKLVGVNWPELKERFEAAITNVFRNYDKIEDHEFFYQLTAQIFGPTFISALEGWRGKK